MKLPFLSYGHLILTQPCKEVDTDDPGLDQLIDDMWETLYAANGVGLAAPQIDRSLQLFIVDSEQTYQAMDEEDREEYFRGDYGIRETFINARITERSDNLWTDTEGCLSIPTVSVDVQRPWSITIEYLDGDLQMKKQTFWGATARMIQHEFDHTQGILFLDYLSSFKRTMLKRQLAEIAAGDVHPKYLMKFPVPETN